VFYKFLKYHMKILLEDFNAKVGSNGSSKRWNITVCDPQTH
jgi:hypothetical protein